MNTNHAVPNNGRAVVMRNSRTGAAWQVSYDYRDGTYWHEPVRISADHHYDER